MTAGDTARRKWAKQREREAAADVVSCACNPPDRVCCFHYARLRPTDQVAVRRQLRIRQAGR